LSDLAPLASVVIPTLEAGPGFRDVLAAIRTQRGVGTIELIVLDSESRDATAALAREAGARVRTIRRATFGHGFTRNVGAALAGGRFVAFLTQDAQPANDEWLLALVESMEKERAIGAYSRVLPRPGCSPLVERSVRNDLVHSPERLVKRATLDELARLSPFERRVFAHFNNVASCVRREDFARLPFPEMEFGEDLAWGARALERGETIVYEPRSLVFHSHESDLAEDRSRHRADALLMRRLFGIRNRDGWRDCVPAWKREVRLDFAHVAAAPLPWGEKLRAFLYSPFLRAAQIRGQLDGSRAPPGPPPRDAEALPSVERAATR
jgi:rhamnosyltransferase